MICPNCKSELSRVWQPKNAANVISIAPVQWSCSTCGESFTSKNLRAGNKRKASPAAPPQPEFV